MSVRLNKLFIWSSGTMPYAIYRILYNPRFPVNLQILSTLEWLNLP